MSLDDKLNIDPIEVKTKISNMIRPILEKRDIDGVVILYRDCVECLTNVKLAIEILGRHNVKLLVTRGRFLNKQPREYMDLKMINEHINLPKENIVFANKEGSLREIREIFTESADFRSGLISSEVLPVLNYNLSYMFSSVSPKFKKS